jgi:hypothetical protein
MIRRFLLPFQTVLLSRRMCVGCTYPLDKAKVLADLNQNKRLVECKCKRRYILERELNRFRRATFEEEQLFLSAKSK